MAKSLIYNENREKQLSEIEMAAIANIYNDEIENFIKFNPNFQVEDSEQRYYKIRAVSLKTGLTCTFNVLILSTHTPSLLVDFISSSYVPAGRFR